MPPTEPNSSATQPPVLGPKALRPRPTMGGISRPRPIAPEPAPVPPLPSRQPVYDGNKPRSKAAIVLGVLLGIFVLATAALGYLYYAQVQQTANDKLEWQNQIAAVRSDLAAAKANQATPSPTPSPTPSAKPTPSPSPSPSPSPTVNPSTAPAR